jgi:glycosyltransferase involved in cell wall biosynthesis
LAAQEAFAAGVPVLASDLGALRERVQHEQNGLLIAPGDARAWRRQFKRVLADPALLPRLRAGIQPVRTIAEHLAEIAAIYEQVVVGTRLSPKTGSIE